MWREAAIAFGDGLASLNCSVVSAHPWVFGLGQQTNNGAYLSPVNAVSYLAEQLAGAGGNADVMIFLTAGNSYDEFLQQLTALADVLPAPAFVQAARLARSAAELETVKMQLPARAAAALPPAVPLSVPSTRAALNAMRAQAAQAEAAAGTGIDALQQAAQKFTTDHAALLAEISRGLADLKRRSARAWVFTGRGAVATVIADMIKNIPQPSAVCAAGMMLVGQDLAALGGMIHDINNAGA